MPWGGGQTPARGDEAGGEVAPDRVCSPEAGHSPRNFVPQFPHLVIEEQVLSVGKLQTPRQAQGKGAVGPGYMAPFLSPGCWRGRQDP